jgi:uncharacterized protein (DUF488 family)
MRPSKAARRFHNSGTVSKPQIYTVGHSTHPDDTFVALLRRHRVLAVADVRRYPASRRNPQFNAAALEATLRSRGIRLEQLGDSLGGRRRPRRGSPNRGWEVEGFRGYADHMGSDEFRCGLERLQHLAAEVPTAVMCAEAQWRRCHRRLIADALASRGWRVLHIGGRGSIEEHEMTPFAVTEGERLVYPPVQGTLG